MTEIDLMEDVGFDALKPMDLVIHIIKADGHFGVVLNGRKADGLGWDEMLGQIVELTHPHLGRRARYQMNTREEFAAEQARRDARAVEKEQQT